MSLSGTQHTSHQWVSDIISAKRAGRLAGGSKSRKPESVFPPLVPSSMTSRIFAFSAAFLRGFLAGGGVYAASGSDHISG